MSQNKKKSTFIRKPWLIFTVVLVITLFIPISCLFGYALWIQSLLLSIFLILSFLLLFLGFLKQVFKDFPVKGPLKGYDSWRLRPFLDAYTPHIPLAVVEHKTPFCFGCDFYGFKKIIISSSLTAQMNAAEKEFLFQYLRLYFEQKFAQRFTQWACCTAFLFFPVFIILFVFQKLNFIRKTFEWICIYILFLPFRFWIRSLFFQLDREVLKVFQSSRRYSLFLQKLQAGWLVSDWTPSVFLSCLFLTNPLTQFHSYFTIQPSVPNRIQKGCFK